MKTHHVSPLAAAVSLVIGLAANPLSAANFGIEEVIVTATKRAESIQDVPISVSAFSGDFLERSGLEDLQDMSNIAPNLYINKSSQAVNQRISIRGVGTVGNNAMDPSVAVYIDGVYMPRPGAVMGNLKDIEMAEVLRGPQGTLFGRNAAMGALNLRTRDPVIAEDTLKVDAGVGSYGAYDSTLIGNKSLTANSAARVVANFSTKDGFGENRYDGSDEVGAHQSESVKVSLLFEPTEEVRALWRVDYQELTGEGGVIEVLPESVTPERLQVLEALGALPDVSGLDHEINQVHEDDMTDRQWGTVLDVTWDDAFAGHTLRSITSYRDWQNDTLEYSVFRLPLDDLQRESHFNSESYSQELQLISPTGERFDYVAGLYYFKEDYDINTTMNLGEDFCPLTAMVNPVYGVICAAGAQTNATPAAFSQQAESVAVFLQGTYHVTERFDLTAGVRYSDDDKEGTFVVESNNAIASGLLGGVEDHELAFADEQVTWLANAKYFITDDIMTFATVSTGYKSGGLNSVMTRGGLTAEQRLFDSEEVMSYELGLKSTLLDNRLMLNATAYRTDIDNFQDRSFQDLTFVIANAGELRQQGLEVDLQYYPLEQLFISVGYAYLDSEFLSFDNGSVLPGGTGTQDLSGTGYRYSPEHQVNLASQWTQALADTGMDWFVRGEVMWTDDANLGTTTNNNPQTIQEAYSLVNLRVGLTSEDDSWSVSAYVENLADEDYCTGMYEQPNGRAFGTVSNSGTLIRCLQGDPRTVGVRGSYYF
ncbi:TonB-dependent receptor [Aestuariicella hydrocarbonica]|uniref:TonB-dependent receptor n=1 Tax=Pseudomaricurvus hydrocarbonicus TaxID=1470433 RepID=A0A9E5JS96_9GAMM|nr:TonB-dependent receptor [Aestuariicella hydrocarbonica]NHO64603.1 TonB-dependent receptor [Aestuariicella hydrocarbonica]